MSNYIEHISLYGGLYSPTLPLDFPKELTTTKQIANIEGTINNIIDIINNWTSTANSYTDTNIKEVKTEITKLTTKIENGDYLKNGSIDFNKLNGDVTKYVNREIVEQINELMKVVNFGLNDEGQLYVDIPNCWHNIHFGVNEKDELVMYIDDGKNKITYEDFKYTDVNMLKNDIIENNYKIAINKEEIKENKEEINKLNNKIKDIGSCNNLLQRGWELLQDNNNRATLSETADAWINYVVIYKKLDISGGYGYIKSINPISFKEGQKYTFSCRVHSGDVNQFKIRILNLTQNVVVLEEKIITFNADDSYKDIEIEFISPKTTNAFIVINSEMLGSLTFARFKLEEGSYSYFTESLLDIEVQKSRRMLFNFSSKAPLQNTLLNFTDNVETKFKVNRNGYYKITVTTPKAEIGIGVCDKSICESNNDYKNKGNTIINSNLDNIEPHSNSILLYLDTTKTYEIYGFTNTIVEDKPSFSVMKDDYLKSMINNTIILIELIQ